MSQKLSKYYVTCTGELCITMVMGKKERPKVYRVIGAIELGVVVFSAREIK